MRIAICDGKPREQERLRHALRSYCSEKSQLWEIVCYTEAQPLVEDILEGAYFHMLFLETLLPDMPGLTAARRLRQLHYEGALVFCTAQTAYAVESYEVQALDYLLKPLNEERLFALLDRFTRYHTQKVYPVCQRQRVIPIPHPEILYIESDNTRCLLHCTNDRCYTLYKRLSTIEAELQDDAFLRCHQSYLVNMRHITEAGEGFLLATGNWVCIRQRELRAMHQRYLDYLRQYRA